MKSDDSRTPRHDANPSSENQQTPHSQYLQLTPSPSSDLEQVRQMILSLLRDNARLEKECQEATEESAKMKQLAEKTKQESYDFKQKIQQIIKMPLDPANELDLLNRRLERMIKQAEEEFDLSNQNLQRRDEQIKQLKKEKEELQKEAERGDWKILQASKGNFTADEEMLPWEMREDR